MNRARAITALAILVLACAGLASWWAIHTANTPPPVAFALPDPQGAIHHASEWRGQVVLLNFWATWCKPCREEIPMLKKAQADYAAEGLQILGLAMDKPEPVRQFVKMYAINYPVLVDMHAIAVLMDRLHAGAGLPTSVLLDRRGRVQARFVGAMSRAQLDRLVSPFLQENRKG